MSGIPQAPGDGSHEAEPVFGTAYSTLGWNAGRPANLQNSLHYPVEALCRCGEVIRIESMRQRGWVHTGRQAGEIG